MLAVVVAFRGAIAHVVIGVPVLIVACAGAPRPPEGAPVAAPSSAGNPYGDDRSGFAGRSMGTYRSDRLGLTIPLPDLPAWTVVDEADRESGWVVATHAATRTVLRVRLYHETSLVGRRECELRAQLVGELPKEEAVAKGHYETLADEAIHRPSGWDARRWVAFEPKGLAGLAGHVFLLAGRGRSCLVVHVRAEVRSEYEANDLADRLELFASRVVVGVMVDHAEGPGTLTPDFPKLPPGTGAP